MLVCRLLLSFSYYLKNKNYTYITKNFIIFFLKSFRLCKVVKILVIKKDAYVKSKTSIVEL